MLRNFARCTINAGMERWLSLRKCTTSIGTLEFTHSTYNSMSLTITSKEASNEFWFADRLTEAIDNFRSNNKKAMYLTVPIEYSSIIPIVRYAFL